MYNVLRTKYILMLSDKGISPDVINTVVSALDVVSADFDIFPRCTALAMLEDSGISALKAYVACKTVEGHSAAGLRNKVYTLKNFLADVGRPLKEIKTDDIRAWLFKYQKTHNISDRTKEKYRVQINSFLEWCTEEEYIPKNPCRKIHAVKTEKKNEFP